MKKNRQKGFTLTELLVSVAIVAVLIALIIPALGKVRALSFDIRQQGQIKAVEIGLETFRNDFGTYPASGYYPVDGSDVPRDTNNIPYYGSEKLAEALFGYDLLGVHPDALPNFQKIEFVYDPSDSDNLAQRKGPYLEADKMNLVMSNSTDDIFNLGTWGTTGGHYISDVYRRDGLKVGLPLLYYRARTERRIQSRPTGQDLSQNEKVYDFRDSNMPFDSSSTAARYSRGKDTIWGDDPDLFDDFVTNKKISPETGVYSIPYRAQSFLLISAGADGIFGTEDDVTNFER